MVRRGRFIGAIRTRKVYLARHRYFDGSVISASVALFHHEIIARTVMVNGGYPISKIQEEIDKCIVLCADCHRKVTMSERGWFRGRK